MLAAVQMFRLQQASHLHLCQLVESSQSLQPAPPLQLRPCQLALPLQEALLQPRNPHLQVRHL